MLTKHHIFLSLSLFLSGITQTNGAPQQSFTIICDLNDTLAYVSRSGVASKLGLFSTAWYQLFHGTKSDIRRHMFNIITHAGGHQDAQSDELVLTDDGQPLPQLMVDWCLGKIDSKQALLKIEHSFISYKATVGFSSKLECTLVRRLLRVLFNPCRLTKQMYPIQGAEELLSDISKNGHTPMLLSNIASDVLAVFRRSKQGKKIFRYMRPEHIVGSADIGLIKPQKSIFEYMITTYSLDPKYCVFIDDQAENVAAARACGMHAIHIVNKDIKKVRSQLQSIGVAL